MIEIALDENSSDIFLNQPRPVFEIQNFQDTGLAAYRQKAKELIIQFAHEQIVIVRQNITDFSINKFALALFIESCLLDNNIECAVIKVPNSAEATQNYKPYVALCIALKFAMRLSQEKISIAYKEMLDTGYLGLYISKDYITQTATFFLKNGKRILNLNGKTLTDALVIIGILKAFSLAKLPYTIHATFKLDAHDEHVDMEELISRICEYVLPYLPD